MLILRFVLEAPVCIGTNVQIREDWRSTGGDLLQPAVRGPMQADVSEHW